MGVDRELPRHARSELEAKKEALAHTRETLEIRTHDLQDKEYELKKAWRIFHFRQLLKSRNVQSELLYVPFVLLY